MRGEDAAAAEYHGARALVLGATGFLGAWVARTVHARGATTIVVGRDAARLEQATKRWRVPSEGTVVAIATDLAVPGAARSLVEQVRPDIVFNCAVYGVRPGERDPILARRLNAEFPGELAESLLGAGDTTWQGCRLVHAGSALEYGAAGGDLDEDTPPQPETVYGRTKAAGTEAIAHGVARGLTGIVARLFTVFGPGEAPSRLWPTLVAATSHTSPIPLTDGRQCRDFTYVEDAAEGMLRLGLTRPTGPVVNVATGVLRPVREFVTMAARSLGIASHRLAFGALPTRPEEMVHAPVSVTRLRLLTAWTPDPDLERCLQRALASGR